METPTTAVPSKTNGSQPATAAPAPHVQVSPATTQTLVYLKQIADNSERTVGKLGTIADGIDRLIELLEVLRDAREQDEDEGESEEEEERRDPAWCPIHKRKMARRSAGRDTWYSHKTDDGWCRGEEPKRRHHARD